MLHRGVLARFGRVRAELAVELFPREAQRPLKRKRPVDEPEVQIETERRPFERPEGVQVERDRVRDDLVEQFFPEPDRAVPQHGRGGPLHVPPKFGAVGNKRLHLDPMAGVRVDELYAATKEPRHLILEPRPLPV